MRFTVLLEMHGEQLCVGHITGDSFRDACFQYSKDYLDSDQARPISISLPLTEEAYSSEKTKCFFEGLLPEGFSRKAVANWIKSDEEDYLSILSALGKECLGALRIVDENEVEEPLGYEKLSLKKVKELAAEGATRSTRILMETHLSLTGASGKVGLYYDEENNNWYLPKGNAPSTHIVKQSHVRFERIVLNEQLCMLTAKQLGIEVPESFIINVGKGADSEILYATKRFDRLMKGGKLIDDLPVPNRLHQEDFAQALGITPGEKYEKEKRGYLQKMFEVIRENSVDPISEQTKLWKRICFNYLIGNNDAHIKNYSLIYSENLKGISLSPAYDIVSTRVYNMTDEMSFYIGDELSINKVNRKSFETAASEAGLSEHMAMKIFDETADGFESALKKAAGLLRGTGVKGLKDMKSKILEFGGYRNL
ncbi:MAG: type II toxin-antitoxin system HipA family toxin [Eubacterium sp.]|nr:type II toxin-antitoxin system HipA family toxin [Eubacterium sp.]